MKTIKVNAKGAGKWADPDTLIAQIEVKEGDEVIVSDALADIMCPHCAKDITHQRAKGDTEAADKEAAHQKNPAKKDKAKAESK